MLLISDLFSTLSRYFPAIHKADIVFIVNPKSKGVSVRKRKGDEVNLNKLAGKLVNGGGHVDSAGGKIGETFLKFTKLFKLVV